MDFFIKPLWTNQLGQSACFSFLSENRFGIYEDGAIRFLVGFSRISRTSFIFHISTVPNGINPKQPPGMQKKPVNPWDLLPTSTGEWPPDFERFWTMNSRSSGSLPLQQELKVQTFAQDFLGFPPAPKAMFGHSKPSKKLAVWWAHSCQLMLVLFLVHFFLEITKKHG